MWREKFPAEGLGKPLWMTGILGLNFVRVASCNASVASQRRVWFGNGWTRDNWPQKTGFVFPGHW